MKKIFLFMVLLNLLTLTDFAEGNKLFADKSRSGSLKKDVKDLYSSKKLGAIVEGEKTTFRIFAPNAKAVSLLIYKNHEDESGENRTMQKDKDGVWEITIDQELTGTFYNFSLRHKWAKHDIVCFDPYAKAYASYNTYFTPRKGIVLKENDYDWEGDEWIQRDWRDLIIYEMHIKDMTAHKSSGSENPGTYEGLIETGKTGGISYIKSLGVNTVELLPVQEFANIEIPYKDSLGGFYNTWNPYERNHWGYMTAGFFAPDELYSTGKLEWNKWSGYEAKQVSDFKDMVKAFHKEGIGVIMDVVYNHVSLYESGGLLDIDKEYYFRLDEEGKLLAHSGCGNDFKTEAPMARKMIIESILYWMNEYHVDGFRFDLGKLLDWETIEEIIREAKKINPHVVIVCEPWGGGYDPAGFSLRGWGSWNDQIRNGIKGENPIEGHGWIFGKWYGNNNPNRIKSYVNGTLVKDSLGLFQKKEHAVNYLESHDGYTLGDFIRLGLKDAKQNALIKDADKLVKLTPQQLKLNKLGAMFLFTSQGITMIHSGQEFARTKVVQPEKDIQDEHANMIDHNSYNKDNETNYINYDHAALNEDLLSYYKGLITLRKTFPAFRHADYNDITFFDFKKEPFAAGYFIDRKEDNFIVLFNANTTNELEFLLPDGEWNILANGDKAGIENLGTLEGKIHIKPSTGMILRK